MRTHIICCLFPTKHRLEYVDDKYNVKVTTCFLLCCYSFKFTNYCVLEQSCQSLNLIKCG